MECGIASVLGDNFILLLVRVYNNRTKRRIFLIYKHKILSSFDRMIIEVYHDKIKI